ncbi:FMN hydrolase/5-amino-6-(5-phospho-D-ribitylamino)uracil phosphatase [Enterococcus sp. DIV0840]|uniref:Cof-type HAD-IIB family hydrolase n=1 Tax=Enterococcus TaxID=1350 RepID=UPI001A903CF6|nr:MULTISPECIES: Cof-type HAD-IIB family hydrolase [Enterococcus]MBO0433817.1 HAD family hydrolase [Enterococcus sp. DIV0849a]MBO0472409.1 HAD family hydrolase [Enterococcus ureasiticus]
MTVKMIAVDMDGTFLNSQQDYDREKFSQLYQVMKQQGNRFVIASGNQYYQLKSFFPEIEGELSFVAENGAYVVSEGEEIFTGEIDSEIIQEVLTILAEFKQGHTILCGKNSAYVTEDEPDSFIEHGQKYYHRLKKVPNLFDVKDDTLFKFALSFPVEQVSEVLVQLHEALGDKVIPVSSGHGDIDLIIPGIHKAHGLMKLQELWGIKNHEVAAFGDSGNDLEMLKHAGYSYVMSNGQPRVKVAAKEIILSNDENGVLLKIEELLGN